MKTHKQIIEVNFDGTLSDIGLTGWQGERVITASPVPGALKFITDLVATGKYEVHITSVRSRSAKGRRLMRQWLREELEYAAGVTRAQLAVAKAARQAARRGGPDAQKTEPPTEKWMSDYIYAKNAMGSWPAEGRAAVKSIMADVKFPRNIPAAVVIVNERAIRFEGKFPGVETLPDFKPWHGVGAPA